MSAKLTYINREKEATFWDHDLRRGPAAVIQVPAHLDFASGIKYDGQISGENGYRLTEHSNKRSVDVFPGIDLQDFLAVLEYLDD